MQLADNFFSVHIILSQWSWRIIPSGTQNSLHTAVSLMFSWLFPTDIKELPLRQHFEECGKVEAVRLVRDPNTGVGKGFGYVLFDVSTLCWRNNASHIIL